jgi:prevent-host-death family protein
MLVEFNEGRIPVVEYEKPKPNAMQVREAAASYLPREPQGEWISAGEFKTHCLRLIERVRQERAEVVVTRYGKPVARLVPYDAQPAAVLGWLAGAVTSCGDLVSPVDEAWDADA